MGHNRTHVLHMRTHMGIHCEPKVSSETAISLSLSLSVSLSRSNARAHTYFSSHEMRT